MQGSSGMCSINMSWPRSQKLLLPKHRIGTQVESGSLGNVSLSPVSFHTTMQLHAGVSSCTQPRAQSCACALHKAIFPQHQESSPFHLNVFFFSIHFYFILFYFFIYFSSVSFSIWKVTWPLFPPSIFLLPLFSFGMKHRTRLKAFNGHSIGEEKSPSELY